jgi:peptide deformylase
MAANMIGVKKRIMAVNMGMLNMTMINPDIIKKSDPYQTDEGSLSLVGVRSTTRYQEIEVEYFDASWKKHKQKYSGYIAQIIQHECNHPERIII